MMKKGKKKRPRTGAGGGRQQQQREQQQQQQQREEQRHQRGKSAHADVPVLPSSMQMSLDSLIYWANGWGADISLAGLAIASALNDFADIRLLCRAVQKAETRAGRSASNEAITSIHDAVKAMGVSLSRRSGSNGEKLGFGHLPSSLSHPDAESLIQQGDEEILIAFLRSLHLCYAEAPAALSSTAVSAASREAPEEEADDPFRNAPGDLREVPCLYFELCIMTVQLRVIVF